MSRIIDILNKNENDMTEWSFVNKDTSLCIKVYSDCKIGVNVSLSTIKRKCREMFYYERPLTRFDVLILLLKEKRSSDYHASFVLKKFTFFPSEYWNENIAKSTTVFGIDELGVKMYAVFYESEEDVDYIKEFEKSLDSLMYDKDATNLERNAFTVNCWLEREETVSGMKRLKKLSMLVGTLRTAAFTIYGPRIASLLDIDTFSIYHMLDRYNGVTVTRVLEEKFGSVVKPLLEQRLIKQENLEIID